MPARKPGVPTPPKGYELVRSGKVREGDLIWLAGKREWGGPAKWNAILAFGPDHKIPCCKGCVVARPKKGRRGR